MKTKQSLADKKATSTEVVANGDASMDVTRPWMGGLSKEELSRPGGILMAMLTQRANELGHSLSTMAEHLNCTYGYLSQLRGGLRKTANISDEFAAACALYLGVPRMTVLLAAGRVRPDDVYSDPHKAMRMVPRALEFMQSDPQFGPMMPGEVFGLSLAAQFFIVRLYEEATGRKLIPGSFDAEMAAHEIQRYQEYRARLQLDIDADRDRKSQEAQDRKDTGSLNLVEADSASSDAEA